MNARRLSLATLAALCVLAGGLLSWGTSAQAAVSHKYLSQLTGFENPTAVAVDAAGEAYVVDTAAKTVDRFSSAGAPLAFSASESYVEGSKLTGTPSGAFGEPDGVAVNDESGEIYVSEAAGHVVDVFSSTGEYRSQITEVPASSGAPVSGPFKGPQGLAVDQLTHDLYVTDPHSEVVDVFSSTGTYVTQFGAGVLGGSYGESVAVNDLTEEVYVGDSGPDAVFVFDSSGSFVPPEWHGASTPDGSFGGGYVYVGLDPTTDHVYVATTQGVVNEFGASASEEYLGQLTGTPSGPFTRPQAVAVAPAGGDLYVADASGVVDVFGPDVIVPDVTTGAFSNLTSVSATLNGHLDPAGGGNITDCHFEYTDDASFQANGFSGAATAACAEGNSFSAPADVHADVSGLSAETTYHYRLLASNANGTNQGSGQTLTTPPAVTLSTGQATAVGPISATLNANVNPAGNGNITDCHFQYIDDTTFNNNGGNYSSGATDIPCDQPTPISASTAVTATPTNLSVTTTYHFRIVATNADGTTVGSDQTFTTPPAVKDVTTGAASNVQRTSATLNGSLDPNGIDATYRFQWGTDTSYGHTAPVPDTDAGSGVGAVAASTDLTGLQPSTVYHFRLLATSSLVGAGTTVGLDQHFLTAPAVTALATLAATNLQPYSATLNGTLNPAGQPLTDCHFEYGTDATYGHSAPCEPGPAAIGSGAAALEVHAAIGGLSEGLTYFFRLVATDAEGTTDGALTLLTTQSSPTPSTCPNETLRTGYSALLPDCRAYEQVTPSHKGATQDLFGTGSGGTFAIPATDGNRVLLAGQAKFGPNADAGAFTDYVFSRSASEWKMASITPPGYGAKSISFESLILSPHLSRVGFTSLPSPSLFVAPAYETLEVGPPGGPSYTPLATTPFDYYGGRFMGASTDLSHLILASFDHNLVPQAAGTVAGAHDLYEFTDGQPQPQLVNVTTTGSLISSCEATLGDGVRRADVDFRGTRNAISNDGSRIFFVDNCTGHLYMRSGGITTDVSAPDPGVVDPGGFQSVRYVGAAADGSKVFFITPTELTPDALAAGTHQSKIYEYEVATQTLTCVSCGDPEDVTDRYVYPSEDGSVVYYVDGNNFIYRYDTITAKTTSIAYAGHADQNQDGYYTTPDGKFFIFTATTTGNYQNYRYDSATETSTCISCAPPGVQATDSILTDIGEVYSTPDRTPMFTPISDNGNYAFFRTAEALVPQDVNGLEDVYEWEANGVDTCTQSSGCVSLISQGNSQIRAHFLGASADGRNVFFATHAQLVPQDIDTAGDIYTARIGGGFAPPAGTGPCEGESCSHPVSAPNDPTPASGSVSGPGNPAPLSTAPKPKSKAKKKCAKGKVLKKGRCVKRKPVKRRAKKAARRAVKHNRGGSK